jgi:hypothetical protein
VSNGKDDGGPAFPRTAFDVNDYACDGHPGMALRDWFAGQALAGNISGYVSSDSPAPDEMEKKAVMAYMAADAMLKARAQ